jgi:outer membrane biosynthesis protein TonB
MGTQGRSRRGLRLTLAGILLAVLLAATLASAASASNYDIRGEWAFQMTCSCGQTASGTLYLKQEEAATGAFSGTALLQGILSGTATGMITGPNSLSLEILIPNAPPRGETFSFTMPNGALDTAANAFEGEGEYGASLGQNLTGEIKAIRTKTLAQLEQAEKEAAERAKEAKEKAEKEAREREAREVQEKAAREKAEAEQHEREAIEKTQREAKEAQEGKERQQAKEAQEGKERQQAKEAQESKERKEREEQAAKETHPAAGAAGAVKPGTLTASGAGVVSLKLTNPDAYATSGSVALMPAAGKSAASKHTLKALAEGSFTLPAHASKVLKLKLSRSAAAALASRGSLRLAIKIETRAGGHATSTKTYSVTLHAAARGRH